MTLAGWVSRYATVTICVLVVMFIAPQAWHSWREWRASKAARGRMPVSAVPAPAVSGPGADGTEPPGMA